MDLKSLIRTIPDWPKEGIMFRDITTLLSDSNGLRETIDQLCEIYKDHHIDMICGIEARGFIIGAAMAYKMGLGFVPIRKEGKLPGKTISREYQLEYGTDTLEMHADALKPNAKVLLVDDLLATGGTAIGASELVRSCGASIVEACFIVDLPDLGGGKRLVENDIPWRALVDFDGE